jgi:hypothetical protein
MYTKLEITIGKTSRITQKFKICFKKFRFKANGEYILLSVLENVCFLFNKFIISALIFFSLKPKCFLIFNQLVLRKKIFLSI